MRWILIDRYETIQKGKYAKGLRGITRSEGALVNHYPCYPVMPSSLLIEMMAQVGGILAGATVNFQKEVILAKLSDAEFMKPVAPPALLEIEAALTEQGDHGMLTDCKISSAGQLVAKANIFFALFDQFGENGQGSLVFSRDFLETYAIRELVTS
jgi:3-hydroxyacyl-[acyl-carrier-protein] dehydratase